MQKALIVDLDGTLFDERHRRVFMDNPAWGKKEYDKFYEAMDKDTAYPWCRDLVLRYFKDRYQIFFITGRPEKYRQVTEKSLHEKCGLSPYHGYKLLMRPNDDYRPDTEIKSKYYQNEISGRYSVEFVLEDRSSVVKMWRELGLVCLQVAEGDF